MSTTPKQDPLDLGAPNMHTPDVLDAMWRAALERVRKAINHHALNTGGIRPVAVMVSPSDFTILTTYLPRDWMEFSPQTGRELFTQHTILGLRLVTVLNLAVAEGAKP